MVKPHQHTKACDPKNAKANMAHENDPSKQISIEVGNVATTRTTDFNTYTYPSAFIEKLPL
jgi:hypothetical protein